MSEPALADQECEACTSEDEPLESDEYADYLAEIRDDVTSGTSSTTTI